MAKIHAKLSASPTNRQPGDATVKNDSNQHVSNTFPYAPANAFRRFASGSIGNWPPDSGHAHTRSGKLLQDCS